ncbi:hypothetical protein [uncultured Cohaesibacter sp.]|uniref:hypothetical protein n=1 Tax=uncultured Cohaesibacter sp. TaxID=1002546 RepID=UPI0029C75D2D|nr:hypothetical protein [uncultured Cohaesibacter sp.]
MGWLLIASIMVSSFGVALVVEAKPLPAKAAMQASEQAKEMNTRRSIMIPYPCLVDLFALLRVLPLNLNIVLLWLGWF